MHPKIQGIDGRIEGQRAGQTGIKRVSRNVNGGIQIVGPWCSGSQILTIFRIERGYKENPVIKESSYFLRTFSAPLPGTWFIPFGRFWLRGETSHPSQHSSPGSPLAPLPEFMHLGRPDALRTTSDVTGPLDIGKCCIPQTPYHLPVLRTKESSFLDNWLASRQVAPCC